MRLGSPLGSSQGCRICDHYDYKTLGGKVGLNVSDSQHFRSVEDVHIKLPTSHRGGL